MKAEALPPTPDNSKDEAEKRKNAWRERARRFIDQFQVPETHTTPNGVELTRAELIADIAYMYRLRMDLGDKPEQRVNQLRETALLYGMDDKNPMYNHVPTVMAAIVLNEEQLSPERRALTLPVRLEIISQALSAEIARHIDRMLFWINPIARDMLLNFGHNAQNVRKHVEVDQDGEPRIVSQEFRMNEERTGFDPIPGSESSVTSAELAQKGYGPESKYFIQGVADMHHDLARMALLNVLRAEADDLRVQLIAEDIR